MERAFPNAQNIHLYRFGRAISLDAGKKESLLFNAWMASQLGTATGVLIGSTPIDTLAGVNPSLSRILCGGSPPLVRLL